MPTFGRKIFWPDMGPRIFSERTVRRDSDESGAPTTNRVEECDYVSSHEPLSSGSVCVRTHRLKIRLTKRMLFSTAQFHRVMARDARPVSERDLAIANTSSRRVELSTTGEHT